MKFWKCFVSDFWQVFFNSLPSRNILKSLVFWSFRRYKMGTLVRNGISRWRGILEYTHWNQFSCKVTQKEFGFLVKLNRCELVHYFYLPKHLLLQANFREFDKEGNFFLYVYANVFSQIFYGTPSITSKWIRWTSLDT